MDAAVTRALVERLDIANPLVVLESLTQIDKLRALALRSDPAAETILRALDAALVEMGSDGRWYDIVNSHLRGEAADG